MYYFLLRLTVGIRFSLLHDRIFVYPAYDVSPASVYTIGYDGTYNNWSASSFIFSANFSFAAAPSFLLFTLLVSSLLLGIAREKSIDSPSEGD